HTRCLSDWSSDVCSSDLAYAARSPLMYARAIAESCVPLQIWWSRKDRVVMESPKHSGSLFRAIARMNPAAPVDEYVGMWIHTHEIGRASCRERIEEQGDC